MSQLDLSGNQLRSLPASLSFLKELTVLDLTANPIHSLRMVAGPLATLPKLADLRIQVKSKTVVSDYEVDGERHGGTGQQTPAAAGSKRREHPRDQKERVGSVNSRKKPAVQTSVAKENTKYILKEDDIEQFQVLFDCLAALYKEEALEESKTVQKDCSQFLKKKLEELGTNLKATPNIKTIQLQNLRSSNSVHLFAFNKTLEFIDKYVDKRLAMVLRLTYNSTAANFEAISDMLADSIKSGTLQSLKSPTCARPR